MFYSLQGSVGQIARRLLLYLGVGSVVAIAALIWNGSVAADEKSKAEAAAIVADLDDIERLRALNPLKLEPDQLDKLVAALTKAQTEYDTKINTLGMSIFGSSAAEARDVKKQALVGTPIPKDFDDKVKRLQTEFLKQRDTINTNNITHVADLCKMVLTDKQVAVATKLERDQWEKDHPDIKNATDAQLYNLYCLDVFISGSRTVALLKEMRAAAK